MTEHPYRGPLLRRFDAERETVEQFILRECSLARARGERIREAMLSAFDFWAMRMRLNAKVGYVDEAALIVLHTPAGAVEVTLDPDQPDGAVRFE